MMQFLIAAPSSGSGKTTVACAVLAALKKRGADPCAFKSGPDYIDPMFHREVLGLPSRNLDLFFSREDQACALLSSAGRGHGVAVLEGVMGCYDGVGGTERASSWHLARATDTPVVLTVVPGGTSLTLAAVLQGLRSFRAPDMIQGVILNQCSPKLCRHLTPILERETGLQVLGHIPRMPDCALASRHLGLITAAEVEGLQEKILRLAGQMEESVDLVLFKVLMEEADGSKKISRCRANLQKQHSLEALREQYIRCYIQGEGRQESVLDWFDANVFPLEVSVDELWQEIRIKEDDFSDFQLSELFVELFTNVLTHGTDWCRISLEGGERSMDICVANAPGEENHGTRMGLKTLGAIVDKINCGTELVGITSGISADNVYGVRIAFDRRIMYRRGRR